MIRYRVNRSRSIVRDYIKCSKIRYRGILSKGIGRYGSRWSQIRYMRMLSRGIGIDKGGGCIIFGGILSRRIGIGACGGGCIRFRDNRSMRIGRNSICN